MSSVRSGTLWICAVLLLAATRSLAQQAPADFKVDLVYQAPSIEHPSAVTCDADGNLFVGEDPMDMRGPSTDPIDRIVLIRWDENGGAPVKTVFCENLSAVFGMVWHQGALYVMNAPYYTMLKDTNGDGVADVRKRLADSFGHAPGLFGLNNHIPSGMRLGLDGFVYVALGDKGLPKAIGVDGSTIRLEGGGVFRMYPDATKLEVVSHGIRNNMDVALDRFDNIFAFDNDDDFGWWTRIIHHVPTGYYGYPYDYRSHRNPFLPPVGEFGSGVACGGACYREVAWPAKYRGGLFFCDWGDRKIEHYTLTKKGASFEAQVEDFMVGDGSGDFRPIDLCFSPDGRHMYVADWNYAGGGKAETVGRLFRVTYVGDAVRREPHRAKDVDPLEAQIQSLGHPSHHERMRAQQRLAAIGKAAVGPVSQLLASEACVLAKVHAIWTQNALMDSLEGYDPAPEWIAALRDADADVRGQAARALGNRRVKGASADLAKSLRDRDAAVRLQAAIALGRIGLASSANPLYEAIGEQDVVVRFTIMQAIRAIGNWQPALRHLRTADKKTDDTIIQTLAGVFDAGAVDVLKEWFREADDPTQRVAALQALAKVHRKAAPYTGGWWGGKAAGGKPARPQEHPWAATTIVLEAIVAGLQQGQPQVRLAALEILREVPAPGILPQVRRMADDDPDQEVRLQATRLLTELKDTKGLPAPSRLAADNGTGNPSRQEAIRAVVATDAKPDGEQVAKIAVADDSPIPLVAKLEPADYAQYATDHRGDPRRGQQLFANTEGVGCIKCHVVGGAGEANLGPDLLGIGAKYPRRELIRSVLEPSNRILTDFEMVVVITTDGVIHQGMVRSQTPERTELITLEGKIIPIRANEIELKETSRLSPMPNGLANNMTLQNFADIIAYLESLKKALPPRAE